VQQILKARKNTKVKLLEWKMDKTLLSEKMVGHASNEFRRQICDFHFPQVIAIGCERLTN
jgi:hypothetical protein